MANALRMPLLQKYGALQEKIKKDAEVVFKRFPNKVLELDALIRSEKLAKINLNELHTDLNIPVPKPNIPDCHDSKQNEKKQKKRKLEMLENFTPGTPTVSSNMQIVELTDLAKPHILQLAKDTNLMKMWIQLLILRTEGGDNLGVPIHEKTLEKIKVVESCANEYLYEISGYFMDRGELISKVAKYPHVDDYRRALLELEEYEFLRLRFTFSEIRNNYFTLYDTIMKNLERIM